MLIKDQSNENQRNGCPSLLYLELVNSKLLFFLLMDNASVSFIYLQSLKRVINTRDKVCLKTYPVVSFLHSRGSYTKVNFLSYKIITPLFIFQSCHYFLVLNCKFYLMYTVCTWGGAFGHR